MPAACRPIRRPDPRSSLVTRRAIVDIVRGATLGSYGVTGFAGGGRRRRGSAERLGLAPRGIRVGGGAGGSTIDLDLTVAHGLPIAEVARQVDSAVRYARPPRARPRGRPPDDPRRRPPGRRRRRCRRRRRQPHARRRSRPTTSPPAARTSPDGLRRWPQPATAPASSTRSARAVANLEAHVDEINALNVFPVPDGDTGTNMLATVRAALDEAEARRPRRAGRADRRRRSASGR